MSEIKKYKERNQETPKEISNSFAVYTSSVYFKHRVHIYMEAKSNSGEEIRIHSITEARLSNAIKKLERKRSLGPDEPPRRMTPH